MHGEAEERSNAFSPQKVEPTSADRFLFRRAWVHCGGGGGKSSGPPNMYADVEKAVISVDVAQVLRLLTVVGEAGGRRVTVLSICCLSAHSRRPPEALNAHLQSRGLGVGSLRIRSSKKLIASW